MTTATTVIVFVLGNGAKLYILCFCTVGIPCQKSIIPFYGKFTPPGLGLLRLGEFETIGELHPLYNYLLAGLHIVAVGQTLESDDSLICNNG